MKFNNKNNSPSVQESSSVSENLSASEVLITSKGNVLLTTTFLRDLIADEKNGKNALINLFSIMLEFSNRGFGDGVVMNSTQGAREFLNRKSDLNRARELVSKMSSQAFDNLRLILIVDSI